MIGATLMLVQARRNGFSALNRKDLRELMRWFAPTAVFEYPGHTPLSGRMEGKPAIERGLRLLFERVEKLDFTIRHVAIGNPFALGLSNTLTFEWDVEGESDGRTFRNRGMTVQEWRRGKIVAVRDFIFDIDVLDAAWGVRRSDAPLAEAVPSESLQVGV